MRASRSDAPRIAHDLIFVPHGSWPPTETPSRRTAKNNGRSEPALTAETIPSMAGNASSSLRQNIASGLTGDPVPFSKRSGLMTRPKSQRLRPAHVCASRSRCALSIRRIPITTIATWWTGVPVSGKSPRVGVRRNVGADQSHIALAQPWHARHTPSRMRVQPRLVGREGVDLPGVAGADEQHVSRLGAHAVRPLKFV